MESTTESYDSLNRCVICAGESTTTICRDQNFAKAMKFFWEGLSMDVKPLESKKHGLCRTCYFNVVEFYDTNDVLLQLEKHLRTLQKTLIKNSIEGVDKLNEDGHPLLTVHNTLIEKWGNGFKSEDEEEMKTENSEGNVEAFLEGTNSVEKFVEAQSGSLVEFATPKVEDQIVLRPRSVRQGQKRKVTDDKSTLDDSDSTSELSGDDSDSEWK